MEVIKWSEMAKVLDNEKAIIIENNLELNKYSIILNPSNLKEVNTLEQIIEQILETIPTSRNQMTIQHEKRKVLRKVFDKKINAIHESMAKKRKAFRQNNEV